jgi:hypothetical protein
VQLREEADQVLQGAPEPIDLFSMMNAVNWWNMSWEAVARGYGEQEQKSADRKANSWMRTAHGCFLAAMACFVASSLLVALSVALHPTPHPDPILAPIAGNVSLINEIIAGNVRDE